MCALCPLSDSGPGEAGASSCQGWEVCRCQTLAPQHLLPLFLTCDHRRAPGSGLRLLQPQGFGCHLYTPILQFSLYFPKFPWSIPLGCLEASETKRVKATPDSLPSPVCLFPAPLRAPAQLAGPHFTPSSARTPESFLTAQPHVPALTNPVCERAPESDHGLTPPPAPVHAALMPG